MRWLERRSYAICNSVTFRDTQVVRCVDDRRTGEKIPVGDQIRIAVWLACLAGNIPLSNFNADIWPYLTALDRRQPFRPSGAQATVREIEALGAKAVAINADLRKGKEATDSISEQFKAAMIATIGEPWLDILVNNAGVAPAISLAQTSESVFDEVMTVNLKAPFFLIQALADNIRDNGRIINISTGFARVAAPTHPAYAAFERCTRNSDAGACAGVRSSRHHCEYGHAGVTETDMNASWMAVPEARAGAEAMSVFSRVGQTAPVSRHSGDFGSEVQRDIDQSRRDAQEIGSSVPP
jgi:3-oxoacyl-[acyl-carrier protein] reductase